MQITREDQEVELAQSVTRHHRMSRVAFAAATMVAAAAIGAASLLVAYWSRGGNLETKPYLALLPFAAATRGLLQLRRRTWQNRRPNGYFDEIIEALRDGLLGSAIIVVFTFFFRSGYAFQDFSYSRLVFLLDWAIATVGLVALAVAIKATLSAVRRRGRNRRYVAIVGSEHRAETIQLLYDTHPEMGYEVVATIDDLEQGVEDAALGEKLAEVARRNPLDEIVLALTRLDRAELAGAVSVAELARVQIRAVPELFGLPPTKVSLGAVAHLPVLNLLEEPLPGGRRALKRGVDIAAAGAAVVLLSPFLALIVLLVRASSPGPALLRQARVGMDGRIFHMLKFRTMRVASDPSAHEQYVKSLIAGEGEALSASKGASLYKLNDDPRVTRIGKVLRRLSLDELPQLFNVIRGEMSLVGPRPGLPFEVALYEEWHRRRLDVRPGMTGLWQVSGRGRIGFQEMVRLDIQYIETWSPLLDVLILLRTIPALLRRETL